MWVFTFNKGITERHLPSRRVYKATCIFSPKKKPCVIHKHFPIFLYELSFLDKCFCWIHWKRKCQETTVNHLLHMHFCWPGFFWPCWRAVRWRAPWAPWQPSLPRRTDPTPATGKQWTGWSAEGTTTAGGWSWWHRWSAGRLQTSGSLFPRPSTLCVCHWTPPVPWKSNCRGKRKMREKNVVESCNYFTKKKRLNRTARGFGGRAEATFFCTLLSHLCKIRQIHHFSFIFHKRKARISQYGVTHVFFTFLYTAAMMAVRTFMPNTKQRWKYCCRKMDCRTATTNRSTAYK